MHRILALPILALFSCLSQEEALLPIEDNNREFPVVSFNPVVPRLNDDKSADDCMKVIWNPYLVTSRFDVCLENHTELEFCGIERKIEVRYFWNQEENIKIFISPFFNDTHLMDFEKVIGIMSNQSGLVFSLGHERSDSQIVIESYAVKSNQKADVIYENLTKPCPTDIDIVIDPAYYPFERLCLGSGHSPPLGNLTILNHKKEIDLPPGQGGNVALMAYHSPVNIKAHAPERVSKENINSAPQVVKETVALKKVRCLIPNDASLDQKNSLIKECLARSPGLFGFWPSQGNTYSEFSPKNRRQNFLNVFERDLSFKCISQLYRKH